MTKKSRPRYTVRKQTSGYNGFSTWYVYDTHKKGRVTVHAFGTPEGAQNSADGLNADHEQYQANLRDPQWVAERNAKLAAMGLAVDQNDNLVAIERADGMVA